jgi:hypothetical protein
MQESKALHYILGASLLMIAVFAVSAFVMVNSQADSSGSAQIGNATPSIAAAYLSDQTNPTGAAPDGSSVMSAPDPLGLTPGGTRRIWASGIVADANGESDIASVKVVFALTPLDETCNPATNSGKDCYQVANCTLDAAVGTNLQVGYNCFMDVQYYATSTVANGPDVSQNWKLYVMPKDQSNVSGMHQSVTREISNNLSVDMPASVDFSSASAYNGPIPLGTNTGSNATPPTDNFNYVVTQKGNDIADIRVRMPNADGLTCLTNGVSTGKIPTANMYYAATDTNIAGSTAFSATTPTAVGLNGGAGVGYQTNGTPVTGLMALNLAVPSTGLGGTCTGTLTVTFFAL